MTNWRNDRLYVLIQEHPELAKSTKAWTDQMLRDHPHVRIKSTSSAEAPVVMQLSGKGPYLPVMEWCTNHRVQLLRMSDELDGRLKFIGAKKHNNQLPTVEGIMSSDEFEQFIKAFEKDYNVMRSLSWGFFNGREDEAKRFLQVWKNKHRNPTA